MNDDNNARSRVYPREQTIKVTLADSELARLYELRPVAVHFLLRPWRGRTGPGDAREIVRPAERIALALQVLCANGTKEGVAARWLLIRLPCIWSGSRFERQWAGAFP